MIVRSIRLKNIKSYGEGPGGDGVTVRFEPGVNRIAGNNGHGKSTLIESLGYALFVTRPIYEEGFDVATYLVRAGKRAGEIDVVFEQGGQAYRVERGLGIQSKRRSKVILVQDGSIEAEGDEEVSAYLCRLLGFPDQARLSELFSKLVGVKQGRLTWPFDSKPAEARRHFEPLLDVEIFRDCFEKLKPVVDRFAELIHERDTKLATIEERIRERASSPEKVKLRQREADELEQKVESGRKEKKDADGQKQAFEQKEQAYRDAKSALESAHNLLKLAAQKKQEDEQRVRESRQAVETANATQAAHDSYMKAAEALQRLQEQQREKTRLKEQRAEAANQKTAAQEKARAARQQAANYTQQKEARLKKAGQLREQVEQDRKARQESQPGFDRLSAATEAARRSREALNHWRETLVAHVENLSTKTEAILADAKTIADWDSKALTQARADEERAGKAEQSLAKKLAETEKLKESFSEQLKEITGGVCPFLKERCRQFEPKKVQANVSTHEKEIKRLSKEYQEAKAAHQKAKALLEKLVKEDGQRTELKKSIARDIESLISAGNNLFPSETQRHFEILRDYLPAHSARLQFQPPAPVRMEDCLDKTGDALNAGALGELLKVQRVFCRQISSALEKTADDLEERFGEFEKQRSERVGAERDVKNRQEQLKEMEIEASELTAKIEEQGAEAAKADEAMATAAKLLTALDEKLLPFARLEDDLREQQRLMADNRPGHEKYLGAKPMADRLPELLKALEQSSEAESQATQSLRQKEALHEAAKREFDPGALAAARQRAEEAGQRLSVDLEKWESARKEVKREGTRFAEWQTACQEKETALAGRRKLEACAQLTQKARQILQKAAPLVAERVCHRIAGRAQQIFNQINPEPIELEWSAERYSLRIDPGERRFAMLSGGEQTKIALAMTLAMIQEFSGLNFCVFDEPTYGVDADSREKLADAIVRLQHAGESRLDQLLLVSHDDAFEGKTENVVFIRKTAGEGSLPVDSV